MNDVQWVKQYIAFAEPQLERVIIGAQLHTELIGVVRGPMTLTFQVRLLPHCMSKTALDRILKLDDVIAGALDLDTVRLQRVSGAIHIEVPLPASVCYTPPGPELARHTKGTEVCVGIDAFRQPVRLDLRQHSAVLWVGPTRSGKTQSMKSVLYALLAKGEPTQFIVLSQKTEDWEPFLTSAACLGMASHADEVLAVAAWAEQLLDERARTKVKTPRIILVADDLINLLKIAPDTGSALGAIASMGAGLGMHLMIGTQEAGSKRGTGDNSVENNVTARVMYRIANAQAAARSAGQGGVGISGLSGQKGDALFLCHGETTRMATGYLKDDWLAKLPQQAVAPAVAPWLRPASKTTHNHPQPAATSRNQPVVEMGGVPRDGYAEQFDTPPVTVVVQPVATTGTLFPIGRRALTDVEAQAVQAMFAAEQSQNAIVTTVYGNKDGKTVEWIREARQRQLANASATPAAAPTTATGNALADLLKQDVKIDWERTAQAYGANQGKAI